MTERYCKSHGSIALLLLSPYSLLTPFCFSYSFLLACPSFRCPCFPALLSFPSYSVASPTSTHQPPPISSTPGPVPLRVSLFLARSFLPAFVFFLPSSFPFCLLLPAFLFPCPSPPPSHSSSSSSSSSSLFLSLSSLPWVIPYFGIKPFLLLWVTMGPLSEDLRRTTPLSPCLGRCLGKSR